MVEVGQRSKEYNSIVFFFEQYRVSTDFHDSDVDICFDVVFSHLEPHNTKNTNGHSYCNGPKKG